MDESLVVSEHEFGVWLGCVVCVLCIRFGWVCCGVRRVGVVPNTRTQIVWWEKGSVCAVIFIPYEGERLPRGLWSMVAI